MVSAVEGSWKGVVFCLALLLCVTQATDRSRSVLQAAAGPSTGRPGARPSAGPPGSLKPGTPAVSDSTGSGASGGAQTAGENGNYGWLFPVLSDTKRGNCVVYEARGSESLQDVARLFGLSAARVLADNQGVITEANQALGGRSILLCGQHGQPPPKPVGPAAAARADAAAEESGLHISRKASQTAPAPATVPPKQQEQALLQLKAVLDPTNNVLKDWGPTLVAPESRVPVTSHCTWTYVSCDSNSNVIRLNLVYLALEGSLPSGTLLVKLPQLAELYLGGNSLQGTLPADWASTTRLTHLYLNDNQLSGRLPPSWGNMKTLRVLSLPYNQLAGPLPASWGNLGSLEDLKLNSNLLAGPIPASYARMDSLATITLWDNANLSGCLPTAWADKSSTGKGFFQSPTGVLSDDIKVATMGTAISGVCAANGSPAAAAASAAGKAGNTTALTAAAAAAGATPAAAQSPSSPAQLPKQVAVEGGVVRPAAVPAAAPAAKVEAAAGNSTSVKATPQRDMPPKGKH